MSHLQHINAFKLDLIKEGITSPEVQIALTRTAYTSAFVRFISTKPLSENDQKAVMNKMLGYWNETFPVNGAFVMASVKSFFLRLYSAVNNAKGVLTLDVCKEKEIEDFPKYCELQSYEDLVKTLLQEIEYHCSHNEGV